MDKKVTDSLEREIKKYHILAWMFVRGSGSLYGDHLDRALWDICGKPSIWWAIEAAKGSKYIDRIAVNTESEEIKKVLRKIDGITLIDRPLWTSLNMPRDYTQGVFERKKPRSLLSREAAIYNEVDRYILYYLEETEGFMPDLTINFSADSPLVTSQIFDRLIAKFFEDETIENVYCASQVPYGLIMINPKTERPIPVFPKLLNRQECPELFCKAGPTLYGCPSKLESGPPKGKEAIIKISIEENLDIHNQENLWLARCYMRRRLEKQKNKNEEEVKSQ